jgi:hypothetical protein
MRISHSTSTVGRRSRSAASLTVSSCTNVRCRALLATHVWQRAVVSDTRQRSLAALPPLGHRLRIPHNHGQPKPRQSRQLYQRFGSHDAVAVCVEAVLDH